jgi:hypothetical protein
VPRPLLVYGASGDLLGAILRPTLLFLALLDVLVLTGALGVLLDPTGWHPNLLVVGFVFRLPLATAIKRGVKARPRGYEPRMRLMFFTRVVLITAGIVFFSVVGLTHA